MGRRNPIHMFGEPLRNGFTMVSNELAREGAHDRALGSDGLAVIMLMLSRGSGTETQRVWETSATQISVELGWGLNRQRASAALKRAEDDGRLVKRSFMRDGQIVRQRCAYVVCFGGRRFTDQELIIVREPIALRPKPQAD